MTSCLSDSLRLSPGLPQLSYTNPCRLSSLGSQPQSSSWGLMSEAWALAPSPPLSLTGAETSLSGCKVLVGTDLCAGFSPPCLLWACCCTSLWGSEALLCLLLRGFLSVWKLSLLYSHLPEPQALFWFLCPFCFLFLLPYPIMWRLTCLFGSLSSSASVQEVFCRRCSRFRCIFHVSVWRKLSSPCLTPPPSWKPPLISK